MIFNEKKAEKKECEELVLQNVGVQGTAKPISVLKLVEDEEKERKKYLLEQKNNKN